jgi:hypothetical protein
MAAGILVATSLVAGTAYREDESLFHTACEAGGVLGSSGPLWTTLGVYVPPPGGSARGVSVLNGTGFGGGGQNSTAIFGTYNWTLVVNRTVQVAGSGVSENCPADSLVALSDHATCICSLGPGVPAGIGQRVELNTTSWEPSSVVDANYSATPVGSISWQVAGSGFDLDESASLADSGLLFRWVNQSLDANLTTRLDQFGIPIRLLSGGTEVVGGTFPVNSTITYSFPAATDQGTWSVYSAGEGSPYPIGGYLFVQTAGP